MAGWPGGRVGGHILVNRILYTAKSMDISNPQNLVCGQIRTFLMSATFFRFEGKNVQDPGYQEYEL